MDRIKKAFVAIPALLGTLSWISFAVYLWSANHAGYEYIGAIWGLPIFSTIGMLFSLISLKAKKTYPSLWSTGFFICICALIICLFVFILFALMFASRFWEAL